MGAVMLGRYTRVRWRSVTPVTVAQLEGKGTSVFATALLEDAEEMWGLAPGQASLLTGCNVEEVVDRERDGIIPLPHQPDIISNIALTHGDQLLVSVEHSGSMWSALRRTRLIKSDELTFRWSAVHLPGAGKLVMGQPRHAERSFALVAPVPLYPPVQAGLGQNGALLTTPFQSEIGTEEKAPPADSASLRDYLDGICHQVCTSYRYGLLTNGKMRWLSLAPDDRFTSATPTTALFRARLALFKRELATRGIYYDDDANETGYELRFAIEDGDVPSSFHEPEAPLAYTVSGEGLPEDDKREQARQLYDPENDWETGQVYAVNYPSLPARIDVRYTDLVYYTSQHTKIDGVAVNRSWASAHLKCAGLMAGLGDRASAHLSLTDADLKRLEGVTTAVPLCWNPVDAADRIQR